MKIMIAQCCFLLAAASVSHAQTCTPQEIDTVYRADHTHRNFFGVEVQVQDEWMMITAGTDDRIIDEPAVYIYRLTDNQW